MFGFNFVNLHKICKCSKLIPWEKCLNQSKLLTILLNRDANLNKVTAGLSSRKSKQGYPNKVFTYQWNFETYHLSRFLIKKTSRQRARKQIKETTTFHGRVPTSNRINKNHIAFEVAHGQLSSSSLLAGKHSVKNVWLCAMKGQFLVSSKKIVVAQ